MSGNVAMATNCVKKMVLEANFDDYFMSLKNLRSGPSKLARASVQLNQFKFRACHIAGKRNSAADAISRTENLPTNALTTTSSRMTKQTPTIPEN